MRFSGNQCKRGEAYCRQEVSCPMRTVTSLVAVEGAEHPLCPVKTARACSAREDSRGSRQTALRARTRAHRHRRRARSRYRRHGRRPRRHRRASSARGNLRNGQIATASDRHLRRRLQLKRSPRQPDAGPRLDRPKTGAAKAQTRRPQAILLPAQQTPPAAPIPRRRPLPRTRPRLTFWIAQKLIFTLRAPAFLRRAFPFAGNGLTLSRMRPISQVPLQAART